MAGLAIKELRHRVTIERKTRGASDGSGGTVSETWSTLKVVSAKMEMRAPREIAVADGIVARRPTIFTIRWRTDVTEAMRVDYKGRKFAINGLRDLQDGGWRWTELTCEEGAPS